MKTCQKQNTLAYLYKTLVKKGEGINAQSYGCKTFFLHNSENLLKTKHSSLSEQSIGNTGFKTLTPRVMVVKPFFFINLKTCQTKHSSLSI
jgi:hypothetical protein